jgi:hypothetical protein
MGFKVFRERFFRKATDLKTCRRKFTRLIFWPEMTSFPKGYHDNVVFFLFWKLINIIPKIDDDLGSKILKFK